MMSLFLNSQQGARRLGALAFGCCSASVVPVTGLNCVSSQFVQPPYESSAEWRCVDQCPGGVFYADTDSRRCRKLTWCDPHSEYETAKPTSAVYAGHNMFISNRVCSPLTICDAKSQYEILAPTPTTDRVCAPLTICDPQSHYEITAPTRTADRVCSLLTICNAGRLFTENSEYESAPPTPTSDRVCSEQTFWPNWLVIGLASCLLAALCGLGLLCALLRRRPRANTTTEAHDEQGQRDHPRSKCEALRLPLPAVSPCASRVLLPSSRSESSRKIRFVTAASSDVKQQASKNTGKGSYALGKGTGKAHTGKEGGFLKATTRLVPAISEP